MPSFGYSDPPSKVTSFFTGSRRALEDEAVVLKDYEVGQRLGEGAYGSVYSIKHVQSGETFALKILQKQDLFLDAGETAAFPDEGFPLGDAQKNTIVHSYVEAFEKKIVQEATVMQALQHPHVVNFYRFLNSKEAYYFIMELAEGGELFDLIISSRFFAENEARFYFQQLMSAIEYCHRKGIAHGDLKAENLLLSKDNRLLVCDFGFSSKNAKENVDDPEATLGTGDNAALVDSLVNGYTGVGTLHYMSPEAIRAMSERAVPDVLLNLGRAPESPPPTTGSPDVRTSLSPRPQSAVTQSYGTAECFTSPLSRCETSSFSSLLDKSAVKTAKTAAPSSATCKPPPAPVRDTSPVMVPTLSPTTKARAMPCSSSSGNGKGTFSARHKSNNLAQTSYSTADMCALDAPQSLRTTNRSGKHSHQSPRPEKTGTHNSIRPQLSLDRHHNSSYGETVSSPKTVADRWSAFVKTFISHSHHEHADGSHASSVRHGMRKSRSTGSLCTDDFAVSSSTVPTASADRKKAEKETKKKKKKKGDVGKRGSFGDLQSCESLTHDGTDIGESYSTQYTRTPDVVSPIRPVRAIVDPYQQDLWSAGVILFFMLTGRLPFDGRDDEETLHLIELDEPSFDEEEQERISPEARQLVLSLLAKEPTDRPSIDDILLNPWFTTYLNVDALFEDRKDELNERLTKAGIVVDSQSAPSFYDLPYTKAQGGLEEQVIETAFHKIATDGYGRITRDELRDMMTTLHGDCVEKKDVSELIRLFTGDAASDDITFQQFRDAWVNRDIAHSAFLHNSEFQLANIVGVQMDEVERQLVRQLRTAFDSVNDDHDGMISALQLRRVFERFHCVVTDTELDSLISYFDTRPARLRRPITSASIDSSGSSQNPSFTRIQSPCPAVVNHDKGITFDAFVQGIVHKDILLRHPLGRRLAAATNLAALFQSRNVTECVRHGFLVSGLQNVILQKLTSAPDRLLLLYTDETVSVTENIYSFRYLGSTALVQGATIEMLGPALASSTVFAMSSSMPGLGLSHGGTLGTSLTRVSPSRRATMAPSACKPLTMMSNGASLDTPVPTVAEFAQRAGQPKAKSTRSMCVGAASPSSTVSGAFHVSSAALPPPGPPAMTRVSKTASPMPPARLSPSATALSGGGLQAPTAPRPDTVMSDAVSPPETRVVGVDDRIPTVPHATAHHHHRAVFPHNNHSNTANHTSNRHRRSTATCSSNSQSIRDTGRQSTATTTALMSPSELGSDDGESQISVGRNSDSIVGTSESGEISLAVVSSSAVSKKSANRGVTPRQACKSHLASPTAGQPVEVAPPGLTQAAASHASGHTAPPPPSQTTRNADNRITKGKPGSTTGTANSASEAQVPTSTGTQDTKGSPTPSSIQSPRPPPVNPSEVFGAAPYAAATAAGRATTPKTGTVPSYADPLFSNGGDVPGSVSPSGSTVHDFLSRSTGYSTSARGHTNTSSVFPHRSLAFGSSGAVPQISGVCDMDIILAPAFLGYTLVRFRRIHGKTNDFHEAVTYVSNLLDVERQQASEDTLPRGESELM